MGKSLEVVNIKTRLATDGDRDIPVYDHTKLSAINTCPTWGIIRYSLHKRMPGAGRAMALEAGSAGHEGFAAVKFWQFMCHEKVENPGVRHTLALYHGNRLFGPDRFNRMLQTQQVGSSDRTNIIAFALEALYTSEFFDDPDDTKRTVSNISESLIAYIDRWDMDRYRIWVRDPNSETSDIGIEVPLDIVVTIEYIEAGILKEVTFRLSGKMDGLVYDRDELMIIENKTGSRLDDSWLAQWIMSHQITGYCIAAGTFANKPVNKALIEGMKIPLGKNIADGIRKQDVNRNEMMYKKWAEWFLHTINIEQTFKDDVLRAPQHTHSCNRYFSSCSFLPLCASENEEEKKQILEEMEIDEWSPLL